MRIYLITTQQKKVVGHFKQLCEHRAPHQHHHQQQQQIEMFCEIQVQKIKHTKNPHINGSLKRINARIEQMSLIHCVVAFSSLLAIFKWKLLNVGKSN